MVQWPQRGSTVTRAPRMRSPICRTACAGAIGVLVAGHQERRALDAATRRPAARRRARRRSARSRPGTGASASSRTAATATGRRVRVSAETAACTSASAMACMPASPSARAFSPARADARPAPGRAGRGAGRRARGSARAAAPPPPGGRPRWSRASAPPRGRASSPSAAHTRCIACDEALDRERPLHAVRAARAGQVGAHRPLPRQRGQHRGPHVRGAAEAVDHQDRVAVAVDLDGHALDELRGHAASSTASLTRQTG